MIFIYTHIVVRQKVNFQKDTLLPYSVSIYEVTSNLIQVIKPTKLSFTFSVRF